MPFRQDVRESLRKMGGMTQSAPEAQFALHCRAAKIPVVPEYQFHPTRRWRADFALPDAMLLIEIEGGIWIKGRHQTGVGFTADCIKYNNAALLGWRIFRFTPDMVKSGEAVKMIEQALKGKP